MFEFLFVTQLTVVLLFVLLAVAVLLLLDAGGGKLEAKDGLLEPPSPRALPVIGHLHLLGGYEVPYEAFTDLRRRFGDVVRLRLGNVQSVVVNGQKNIREVLVTKGHHFDSRPNFERYRQLFCGNKENSLAFCDWSDLQKTRRDMLKAYTFPRAFTNKFNSLENIIFNETSALVSKIEGGTRVKAHVLEACANIFTSHFCSMNFAATNRKFVAMVENFDDIFYEVNQGYAADFLPFLLRMHSKHLAHMNALTHSIRQFILEEIVGRRFDEFRPDDEPSDYVESLIREVKYGSGGAITWDTALFALEDIIGGHSAVGNFLVKIMGFLVNEPHVQRRVQGEIDAATSVGNKFRNVSISDRNSMPYTEAVIFEAIRLVASPIVPRVANQDSSVNGYRIKKGSLIFLNNHDLSMSRELWSEPERFEPERFLAGGRFVKPDHFLPFGGGRRSCMGYKMVQLVTFGVLSALLQNYTICPAENQVYKVPVGSLALPRDTFEFRFVRRTVEML